MLVMKYAALLLLTSASFAQSPKRLFIEERVVTHTAPSAITCRTNDDMNGADTNCSAPSPRSRTRDVSAELTRDIMTRCPSAISITDNLASADYRLHISPGSSLLYNAKGDVVYVSPARVKLDNVGKDVCQFVSHQ